MAAILDKHVQCNNCKERYPLDYDEQEPDEFGEYNQGVDCDCTILQEGVRGHYGSCIDDVRNVIWVNGKPDHLVIGKQLCDTCIKAFLKHRVLLIHNQCEMQCEDLTICGCADCLAEIEHRVPNLDEHDTYRCWPDNLGCSCNKCKKLRAIWQSAKNPNDHFLNAWRRKPSQMRECGCFACVEILASWAE